MAAEAYDYSLTTAMYAASVILQMLSSFLSIVGALIIIRIATPKLGSTYQRFLFLMSIATVINSLFLFLHPLLVPKGSTVWSVGNDATCSMVGFFWVLGAFLLSLYHNALALYFYFSIQGNENGNNQDNNKQRQKDPEDVIGCSEMSINFFCWLSSGAIAGAGAAVGAINFDSKVDMCLLYQECDAGESEYECLQLDFKTLNRYGTSTSVVLRDTFQWTLIASASLSVLVMAKIQWQARRAMKRGRDTAHHFAMEEMDLDSAEEQEQFVQKLSAVSTQCMLYTLSYLNSYVWIVALIFIPVNNANLLHGFQMTAAILYPSLGVFNCVIYIRPRVQMLQIMYPQDPLVVVVRVAMSRAGDPDEIEMVREIIYGSEYSGSEAHPQGSDDGESRDSAIPSVVHFDPEEKPLSITSLVSTPGEGDVDINNESLLSPLEGTECRRDEE